jgi:hypothetical protein
MSLMALYLSRTSNLEYYVSLAMVSESGAQVFRKSSAAKPPK